MLEKIQKGIKKIKGGIKMLSTTQIVLLVFIGIFALVSIGFMIAFIVEIVREPKTEEAEESPAVKSVFEININNNSTQPVEEKSESVNEMLADLDKLTEGEVVEEEAKAEEEPAQEEEAKEEEKAEEPSENTTIINIVEDAHEPIVPGSLIDYETRLANVIEKR